jgi:hypothetical protein
MHVGPIVYKDLTQDLVSRVAFDWTGLQPNETDPACDIFDKNGEVHRSKLGVYYGKWHEHLNHVLKRTWEATQENRKVLVLCSSIDEAVNLCALWNGMSDLYTDIPEPAPHDVQETLAPIYLSKEQQDARAKAVKRIEEKLLKGGLSPVKKDELELQKSNYELVIKQCAVQAKITKEHNTRKREYLKRLKANASRAGLMIHKVSPTDRRKYLEDKQVVFAIKKYGREGLNSRELDTVIMTMPTSSRNGIQQLKGRTERQKTGKKSPLLLVIEHNIGPIVGSCKKMRAHLREWPIEEGGPFEYELHGHPKVKTWTNWFG